MKTSSNFLELKSFFCFIVVDVTLFRGESAHGLSLSTHTNTVNTRTQGSESYPGQEKEQSYPIPSLGKACLPESWREDCVFRLDHLLTHHEIYFRCQKKECICTTLTPSYNNQTKGITKATNWDIIWDEDTHICKVAEFGPCGEANNLQVDCQRGFLCIESRCRNPRKLQRTSLGALCWDDIDCLGQLVCAQGQRSGKECVNPLPPTKVSSTYGTSTNATMLSKIASHGAKATTPFKKYTHGAKRTYATPTNATAPSRIVIHGTTPTYAPTNATTPSRIVIHETTPTYGPRINVTAPSRMGFHGTMPTYTYRPPTDTTTPSAIVIHGTTPTHTPPTEASTPSRIVIHGTTPTYGPPINATAPSKIAIYTATPTYRYRPPTKATTPSSIAIHGTTPTYGPPINAAAPSSIPFYGTMPIPTYRISTQSATPSAIDMHRIPTNAAMTFRRPTKETTTIYGISTNGTTKYQTHSYGTTTYRAPLFGTTTYETPVYGTTTSETAIIGTTNSETAFHGVTKYATPTTTVPRSKILNAHMNSLQVAPIPDIRETESLAHTFLSRPTENTTIILTLINDTYTEQITQPEDFFIRTVPNKISSCSFILTCSTSINLLWIITLIFILQIQIN